jgi:hypothetical protein
MACEVIPSSLLEGLASTLRKESEKDSKPGNNGKNHHRNATQPSPSNKGEGIYDLEAFMLRNFPEADGPAPYAGGGRIWILPDCFFRPGDGPTMFTIQHLNGSISAGCQHATCPGSKSTGNHWKELREHFEGSSNHRQFYGNPNLDGELATIPRTEFGLAERFRRRFGEHCRFIETWGGKWLVYNGQRWELSDCAAEIYAQETIHAIRREAWYLKEEGDGSEEGDSSEEKEEDEGKHSSSHVGDGVPEGESDQESPKTGK